MRGYIHNLRNFVRHVRMNSIIEGIVVTIFDGAPWDYPIYP